MKVGDLVKYECWHEDLQDRTGVVIETSPALFYHGRVRVLWSKARPGPTRWDWIKDLRTVNESR